MATSFAGRSLLGALAGGSITLGSFLSSVVVARALGAEGSGAVAYVVWLAFMMTPLLDMGLSSAIERFVPELRGRGEPELAETLSVRLARTLALSVGAGLLVLLPAVAAAAGLPSIGAQAGSWTDALWLMPVLVAAQSFGAYAYACLRGAQAFGPLARLSVLSLVLQIAGVTAGSLWFGIAGAVAGYAAGHVPPAIAALRLAGRRGGAGQDPERRVRRYAAFAWAANIANAFVWSRTELFFLERYGDHAQVGLFTAALTLVGLVAQAPLLLTTAFLPLFSEKLGRGDIAAMRRAYAAGARLLAAVVFPACLGMAAIMPALLPLIYGQAFAPAVPAAMVLVCAAALSGVTMVETHLVHALERSDFVFFCSIVGAALALLAGFLLVPSFGLMGAAFARAAVQVLMVATGVWFAARRLGYPLPFAALGRLLGAALASAAVAAFCVHAIASPFSILAAIPAAAATHVVALRLARALTASDLAALGAIARALPAPLAAIAAALTGFVAGEAAAAGEGGLPGKAGP